MKSFLTPFFIIAAFQTFAQAPAQTTGAPVSEVTHEKKNGSITTAEGTTYEGTITFSEYGKRTIYLYQDGQETMVFENPNELASMTIEGRGTFEPILLMETATEKVMALVTERNEAYTEYNLFSAPSGVLGVKISGGMVQGSYNHYLRNHRNDAMISEKSVANIKKNVRDYIDYCDAIATKVEDKEKGYKVTLLTRDYDVLKTCIAEAATSCPE